MLVRETERDIRVAREAGGVPPRLAQEAERLGGVPAGEQEAGQIRCGQERLGVARPPQAPLLAEDGPRQLQGVLGAALEVVGEREVRRDDEGPRVVADAGARLEARLELRARFREASCRE